jgi:hypothetical protein
MVDRVAFLEDEKQALEESLISKEEQVLATTRAIRDLQRGTATTTGWDETKKMTQVPHPPEFEKGRTEYRTWKSKLKEKLAEDTASFRGERHKLSYAMGYLKGQAYDQVAPLRENGTITTPAELLARLDATFEDSNPKKTAERELKALCQGKTEFSVHYASSYSWWLGSIGTIPRKDQPWRILSRKKSGTR